MVTPGNLDENVSASTVDADRDSKMSEVPGSTSAEPQGPKKFDMPFEEESASSTEYVPKRAKLAKRKPVKSRRPIVEEEEEEYPRMDDWYWKLWSRD